jgi:cytochrome c biogenesis protein CcmG, thiol:disulfide interchange protein DsbE
MIGRRAFLAGMAAGLATPALGQDAPAPDPNSIVLGPFSVSPLQGLPDIPAPTLEALTGQITVLNVWASWCQGCQEEHDFLLGLQQKGVRIAGIDVFDRDDAARRYLEEQGNPFAMLGVDDRHELTAMLAVRSIPQSFLIGPGGEVLWHTEEGLDNDLTAELLTKIAAMSG